MDAVLPLTLRDTERAKILLLTLCRFFPDMDRLAVFSPPGEVAKIQSSLHGLHPNISFSSELKIAPEISLSGKSGWFKQQLVKLAFAEHSPSPFYLTLDADVLCVRPTTESDLVREGRAVAQLRTFRAHHARWYPRAKRILELEPSGRAHGVTPAVLSKNGVRALATFLETKTETHWRLHLAKNFPWTEYALYHTFLEGMKIWNDHHYEGEIYGNCAWTTGPGWKSWQPEKSFLGSGPPFSVVQSKLKIPPAEISAKIAPFLT